VWAPDGTETVLTEEFMGGNQRCGVGRPSGRFPDEHRRQQLRPSHVSVGWNNTELPPTYGVSAGELIDINYSGRKVVWSERTEGEQRAVLWHYGEVSDLGVKDGTHSSTSAVIGAC
jgi:hypothetical protein